jgi:hypothetical protein
VEHAAKIISSTLAAVSSSAKLAETSAARTANAAKVIVQSTRMDLADAETDVASADIYEAKAHEEYRNATDRAARKSEAGP